MCDYVENTQADGSSGTLDIPSFIRKLMAYATPQIEMKHLHLRYRTENVSSPKIEVDEKKLKRLFERLLDRAITSTPPGGDVIFSVSELSRSGQNMTLEFYVQDNGIGMTPEEVEQATAEEKPIVDALNGRISFESRINIGTIAHIVLTVRAVETEADQPVPNVSRDVYNFKGKRVLLVEDHPLNLEIAKNMLEHVGFEVDTAVDGQQAVDQYNEEGDSLDLILMDIRMPVKDGVAATQEIRSIEEETGKNIPIIALTASAYEGDVKRARDAGMNDSILKPIDPAKMYDVISEYLYTKKE